MCQISVSIIVRKIEAFDIMNFINFFIEEYSEKIVVLGNIFLTYYFGNNDKEEYVRYNNSLNCLSLKPV